MKGSLINLLTLFIEKVERQSPQIVFEVDELFCQHCGFQAVSCAQFLEHTYYSHIAPGIKEELR